MWWPQFALLGWDIYVSDISNSNLFKNSMGLFGLSLLLLKLKTETTVAK